MKTIMHFVKKEFLQFKRDPRMFAIILFAPIIQLTFLGYAANMDVENVKTAIIDRSKSSESRVLIEKLEQSGYFSIDYYINDYKEAEKLIEKGKVICVLSFPVDFDTKLSRDESAQLQAIFDGSDGNTASIAAGYMIKLVADHSQKIALSARDKSGMKINFPPNISAETRNWYNPTLKTRDFMVPAIVGLLLMIVTLILTSLAIVKEKEIGTMEQLIVTPIKPHQLIIGKLIPFTILGMVSVVVVLTAMRIIFNIPVRGSILLLFVSSFFYVLSLLGFGLFISTISKTQQQAMMLSIFVVMLPMTFLSGFAFPVENMPYVIQLVSYLIPLKYFVIIIRGIILKGVGIGILWDEILILFLMGITILYFSSKNFHRKIN